jgi:hypothetical protein
MGSGEGEQGLAGGPEAGQGRAGGGTTYTWRLRQVVLQEEWESVSQMCDLKELRHPFPMLTETQSSESTGRQEKSVKRVVVLGSFCPSGGRP